MMERKRGEGYPEPLAPGTVGQDLGDKLHGPARNRGVDETTGNIAGTTEHAEGNFITGPNKLHKDPPASHPASQGGVAADGTQIQPGTGRTL
jgi:hypothetical protein